MSVSYSGLAVVGCQVPIDKFDKVEDVPGCEHQVPEGNKFCPECGAPALKREEVDFDWYEFFDEHDELTWGFTTDDKELIVGAIGAGAEGEGENLRRANDELENLGERTKAVLEPLGLWDLDTFDLWCVMRCSY
jgi:hypothetical protein